jgi:hypothetical protein
MGWNKSPANRSDRPSTQWRSSQYQRKTPRQQSTIGPTHQMSAVYVDNFLLAAVEDDSGTLLQRTARPTLHAIHNALPSPTATGTPDTEDPISEKKLTKGDAWWDTTKEIPGYLLLDGVVRMIRLGLEVQKCSRGRTTEKHLPLLKTWKKWVRPFVEIQYFAPLSSAIALL